MSELEQVTFAAVSGHLMWRATKRGAGVWDRGNWREEIQDWQNNISADSAAASKAALTFSECLEEAGSGESKYDRKREKHTNMWPSEIESAGQATERWGTNEGSLEGSWHRTNNCPQRHTYRAEFAGNQTPALVSLDDLMKDNRAAGKRREEKQHHVP